MEPCGVARHGEVDVAHVLEHYELQLLGPHHLQLRGELLQPLPILTDDLPMGQSVAGAGGAGQVAVKRASETRLLLEQGTRAMESSTSNASLG